MDENKVRIELIDQTEPFIRRFLQLKQESPEKEWAWIVGHYQGDQDELDHILNRFVNT